MRRKVISTSHFGLFGILIVALLSLGTGAGNSPDQELGAGFRRITEAPPGERDSVSRALVANTRMADLSLEVREQGDFLLTPALLVQEAVSDGMVLTYPEE